MDPIEVSHALYEGLASWCMSRRKGTKDPNFQDLCRLARHCGLCEPPKCLDSALTEFLNSFDPPSCVEHDNILKERIVHSIQQANRMVAVYTDILKFYGVLGRLHPKGWLWYGVLGLLEKYLKWSTADFLARTLDQEDLPPNPGFELGLPFTGPAASHLKRVCLFNRKRGLRSTYAVALAYSLYQGKGGSLPVSAEFLENSVERAVNALCTPRTGMTEDIFDVMSEQVRRTVRECFPRHHSERARPGSHRIPSLRSSFQNSRKDWGAFGHIVSASISIGFPYLLGHWHHKTNIELVYGPSDPEDVQLDYEQSYRRAVLMGRCRCYPVGLLEPFKVRVITRGDADMYHLARRWQKTIHGCLRQHPTFQLIGGPIDWSALNHLSERTDICDDRYWVSADYTSATDNLDPELSRVCMEEICQRLGVPLEDQLVLLRTLTDHDLYEESGDLIGSQAWGQLMGSPSSFPILCLINAAATRFALELANWKVGEYKLTDLPMLFNGDDAAFRANEQEYTIWKGITKSVGLEFSVGKNFFHKRFLILNSAVHEDVGRVDFFGRRFSRLEPVVTLSSSLLYGQVRVQSASQNDRTHLCQSDLSVGRSLGKMCEDLVAGHSEEQRDFLIKRFIQVNKTLLAKCPKGQAWCIPRRLGGLGLPAPSGYEPRPPQAKLAAYLATRQLDDPDLRDYLYPDQPDFLRAYISYRQDLCRKLGIESTNEQVVTLELPDLALWAPMGAAGGDKTELVKRSIRAWESLKKRGLATSLHAMKMDTIRHWTQEPRNIADVSSWTVSW
ncbi:RNA-dependent RNA polymerase [Beihai narna-like virus 1]|uniref:RNA-dependent RNA polymerase n=1 Tax=Beihai narna-like virus 1 TaxID=1922436 RepID=UPI00090BE785|nr:RNA-dependent RNA polymerase [Beihai narna-like virus 1]APG77100.1 RNA-dependent RNA polymerase [Beihai narna-like virus 1]